MSKRRAQPWLSDPSHEREPAKKSFWPSGPAGWIGTILYAFFWVVLLLPKVRRQRRDPNWWRVQVVAGLLGLATVALGLTFSTLWLTIPGGVLVVLAVLLRGLRDPEHERKLQARYQSDYFLNGGKLSGDGLPGVPTEKPLYLLLKGEELLFVPSDGLDVAATLVVPDIEDIRVGGEHYVPVYVSEAKDPPVRETHVDQTAVTPTELLLKDGRVLRFEYSGTFHKHLAETAAHAIYSVKRLAGSNGVGSESPEVLHVIGGNNVPK